MRQRIYPDTSVIGGVYDPEFADWSKRLIQEFKEGHKIAVISDLTLKEIEDSPEDVRPLVKEIPNKNKELVVLNDNAKSLAMKYISEGAVTEKYLVDAQHIAIATIYRVDVLVSWNFKH
ncbi:MAG: PIN domain protein, partial [Ignavibacteriales bacterium]|nr:PIN domain protein [Ignavibacteriales bacterium]